MKLHFQQFGAGPPLVILHGLLGSSDNWITLSRRFGQRRKVFALDLRNHGRSPHSDSMSHAEMADDVARFLDARGLSCVALMGHSLGGKAAMETALIHPERVGRLIVVDIAPRAYPPRHANLLRALAALDLERLQDRTEALAALEKAIPSLPLRRFVLKNLEVSERCGMKWRINLNGIRENYAGLTQGLEPGRTFKRPTLIVRGGKSDHVTDGDFDAMRDLFPSVECASVAGAGHWVHADAPDAFYTIVSRFLAGGH